MASLGKLKSGLAARGHQRAIDAEEMIDAALVRARRRDFSNRSFVEPLSRLVASYNTEADLSAFGRYAVRFDIMRCLKNLLYLESAEEARPEILSRPIERPIFITGLPRSGTTFFHELLAQDPAVAAPLAWQMFFPDPPRARVFGRDLRIVQLSLQLRIMQALSPELAQLHPLSATAPQECTEITAQIFQSLRFDSTHRVPSYQNWLSAHGHNDAYRFHRRFLQHLDERTPGRRWVLKCPDHVFALDAIRAVYPDAKIVFLHRDPLSVLASVAKLTEVLRRPFARHIDRSEIGRQVCSSWLDGADRMMEAAQPGSVLNLHYKHVVSAPMDAVAELYRYCGLTLSEDAERRMREWLRREAPNGNGQSRYSLQEFGLEEETLSDQFAHYMRAFGVAEEWNRNSRPQTDARRAA